jgi:hypothetical protein
MKAIRANSFRGIVLTNVEGNTLDKRERMPHTNVVKHILFNESLLFESAKLLLEIVS